MMVFDRRPTQEEEEDIFDFDSVDASGTVVFESFLDPSTRPPPLLPGFFGVDKNDISFRDDQPVPRAAPFQLRYLEAPQVIAAFDSADSEAVDLNGQLVADYLANYSTRPHRTQQTADGSTLLEYGRRGSVCVDVFPNGDVVVIIGKGELDNIYEFDLSELPKVAELLRDAGFGR